MSDNPYIAPKASLTRSHRGSLRTLLAVLLLVPLLAAFSYGHLVVSDWLSWLMYLSESRPIELALLLISPVLANLIGALVFALPILWLYGRGAAWIALVVSLLTALWQFSLMGPVSSSSFVVATWIVEFFCLVTFLPLAVLAFRRLRPNNSFKPKPLRGSA